MVFTYYMHTKELHAIFHNYASSQASWVSTSTACNSYPHIIHVNILSMHIPTSFSQKKKKNRMLFKPRNQHANWIFFPSFPAHKKNSTHIPTSFPQKKKKKVHVIQTKKLTCKLDFLFLVFQLRKTAPIYQHHSYKKTSCYSNQEINMQTRFFQVSSS